MTPDTPGFFAGLHCWDADLDALVEALWPAPFTLTRRARRSTLLHLSTLWLRRARWSTSLAENLVDANSRRRYALWLAISVDRWLRGACWRHFWLSALLLTADLEALAGGTLACTLCRRWLRRARWGTLACTLSTLTSRRACWALWLRDLSTLT